MNSILVSVETIFQPNDCCNIIELYSNLARSILTEEKSKIIYYKLYHDINNHKIMTIGRWIDAIAFKQHNDSAYVINFQKKILQYNVKRSLMNLSEIKIE